MERAKLDFWVGLFVMAGFAALLGLALKVGNMTSFSNAKTYAVQASFNNIGSLKVRSPVKSAGVVVGRVSDISFDNQSFDATVTLQLDAKYQFPKDTSAAILTAGLLGEQFVALDAGGDVENLVSGDKIKITQSTIILENLISQFLFNKASDTPKTDAAQTPTQGMQP